MDAQELRNLQEAYMEVVMGEGKVPWDDPDHPLQSGHTPAEKNRAKRARTGVENPNKQQMNISDKDMARYGGMKEVDDTETSKSPKQKKTLLGKKKPLEHKTPPHKFKKERHVDNTSDNPYSKNSSSSLSKPATHTKGQGRRAVGDKWDSTIAQTPIRADDTRRRTSKKWGGPNPRNEQVDIYDIILSHLLDEGYAETPEAAEAIMVNMSEEWRDSIVNL